MRRLEVEQIGSAALEIRRTWPGGQKCFGWCGACARGFAHLVPGRLRMQHQAAQRPLHASRRTKNAASGAPEGERVSQNARRVSPRGHEGAPAGAPRPSIFSRDEIFPKTSGAPAPAK